MSNAFFSQVIDGTELMYAAVGGMIVEMTPLRSIVPGLPPIVHHALGGILARPIIDMTRGGELTMPDILSKASAKKAAVAALAGMIANGTLYV